jgi:hypothetical protein
MSVDPVCLFHGMRWSEHPGGRCLYCCICFEPLTVGDCWRDQEGVAWDICGPCALAERLGNPQFAGKSVQIGPIEGTGLDPEGREKGP